MALSDVTLMINDGGPYLVLGKGDAHVVVEAMIEHVDDLAAELSHATGAHCSSTDGQQGHNGQQDQSKGHPW